MGKLTGLKPDRVFYYFEELTKIPRCSGNELRVAQYIEGVAEELGLNVVRDEFHNVIVEKPSQGGKSSKKVILQAHTDMVCVARDGYDFDFSCSPIPVKVDGDWVMTEGTTLGADNGIGASMLLAVMEDKQTPYPAMAFLFTATEETGMNGVIGLKKGSVKGDMLINIDSEEEGVLLTSCAGGINHTAKFPLVFGAKKSGMKKITVSGLKSGHSGMEIVKERANALQLLARVLEKCVGLEIASIKGGVKMNAIPQSAEAIVLCEGAAAAAAEMKAVFVNEYAGIENGIEVSVVDVEGEYAVMGGEMSAKLVDYILLAPHGVQRMSHSVHGLVETSANLAIIEMQEDALLVHQSVRSSVRSRKYETAQNIVRLTERFGGVSHLSDGYPEWQYREESYLREHMKGVWKELYGSELKVGAIHAGLECGYLGEKIGDIDMVSIGPEHHDVHTPDERVRISSVERVFKFLVTTLEKIA